MALHLPPSCQPAHACLDYQAFLFALTPSLTEPGFARLCDELRGLGRIRREALGVTYVDGDWGFLVIPPYGFPELKINFFHGVPAGTAQRLLGRIAVLLADAETQGAKGPATTSASEQE